MFAAPTSPDDALLARKRAKPCSPCQKKRPTQFARSLQRRHFRPRGAQSGVGTVVAFTITACYFLICAERTVAVVFAGFAALTLSGLPGFKAALHRRAQGKSCGNKPVTQETPSATSTATATAEEDEEEKEEEEKTEEQHQAPVGGAPKDSRKYRGKGPAPAPHPGPKLATDDGQGIDDTPSTKSQEAYATHPEETKKEQ